jgi:hypothetical protein
MIDPKPAAFAILLVNSKMSDKLQPEFTDKDVMKGNDRLGNRSANCPVCAALINV